MLPIKRTLLPAYSRFFEDDWNNLFDWSNQLNRKHQSTRPSVNILEEADSIIVEMAVPGMSKENFHIETHNDILTVKAETQNHQKKEASNYKLQEFDYQSFSRSFNLSHKVVDTTKIAAKYHDGILRLTLPKKEEAKEKPARQIPIT